MFTMVKKTYLSLITASAGVVLGSISRFELGREDRGSHDLEEELRVRSDSLVCTPTAGLICLT